MNHKTEQAFNEQIRHELQSDYLYLSMAAWFHSKGLDGMSHWMKLQAKEEFTHAMKFFDHICDRGGKVTLLALEKPRSEWNTPADAFAEAYKHELLITEKINALVKLAAGEADYAATPLLNWFVNEQIEEEAQTQKISDQLAKIGSSGAGLIMLDKELGKRE